MSASSLSDRRDHIQQLTDEHKLRERSLLDENASLLNQLNAAQTELRDGVGKVKEKAALPARLRLLSGLLPCSVM